MVMLGTMPTSAEGASSRPQTMPPNYPSALEQEVLTSGSFRYTLRPIRPDDARRLIEFHSHLSPHSSYLRFFTFHPELSEKEVERFTCVDYEDRMALVAEVDDHLIAVGRYDRCSGTAEAEVAFIVADDYQYHGIGSLLLDELARVARTKGITTFVAETLQENRTMLGVFFHSGFTVSSSAEYGTVTLRFPIEPTDTYLNALGAREESRRITPIDHRDVAGNGRPSC